MIPGYAEAIQTEQEARDFAFLALPETICGVDVRQMTCGDFLLLMLLQSPFLCGGETSPETVAQFLWVMSPGFSTEPQARAEFLKTIAHIPFVEAVSGIREYLDNTFMDAPGSRPGGPRKAPTTSFVASIVHRLAITYSWSEQEILKIPLVRIYQYLRRIQIEENPKAIIFNRRSDGVKAEYLREINAKNKADREAEQGGDN